MLWQVDKMRKTRVVSSSSSSSSRGRGSSWGSSRGGGSWGGSWNSHGGSRYSEPRNRGESSSVGSFVIGTGLVALSVSLLWNNERTAVGNGRVFKRIVATTTPLESADYVYEELDGSLLHVKGVVRRWVVFGCLRCRRR